MSALPAPLSPVDGAAQRPLSSSPDLDRAAYICILASAVAIALMLRLLLVLPSSFPLRDGGMFYVMLQDLARSHLALPRYVSYNGGHIPFAYPPLAFYTMEVLHLLTGLPFLTILRFFAVAFNMVAIVAFILLARSLLSSRTAVVVAVFAFGILPRGMYLAGGDAPRAMGLCFALLTLWQVREVLTYGRTRNLALAVLFASLTAASHLEWIWFLGYSVPLLFLFSRRTRSDVVRMLAIAAGTLVCTSPWWLTVVLRSGGVSPFVSALSGSSSVFPWYGGLNDLLQLHLTDEAPFPVFSALALGGIAYCLTRRQWLLPSWLLLIFLAESRASVLRRVILVALLAGIGMDRIVLPLLRQGVGAQGLPPAGSTRRALPRLAALAIAFLLLRGIVTSWGAEAASVLGAPLPPQQRAMMTWVRLHSPHTASFLLVTGVGWSVDDAEEWFPALAERRSLDTVQGYEWLPGQFAHRYALDTAIQRCAMSTASCLTARIRAWHLQPDYVVLLKGQSAGSSGNCCQILRTSLLHDPHFFLAYNGPGAAIFRVH